MKLCCNFNIKLVLGHRNKFHILLLIRFLLIFHFPLVILWSKLEALLKSTDQTSCLDLLNQKVISYSLFLCFRCMFLTRSTEQNISSSSAASWLVDPVPHMDGSVRGSGQERPWPLGMPDVGGDEDAVVRLRWNCVTAVLEQRLHLLQLRPPDWRVVDLNGSTETCQRETHLLLHLVSWSFSAITDQQVYTGDCEPELSVSLGSAVVVCSPKTQKSVVQGVRFKSTGFPQGC